MRNVYWLAIDKDHTSYKELVDRRVVAQGWRMLGELRTLCRLFPQDKELFVQVIQSLGDKVYGGEEWWDDTDRKGINAPQIMWSLLNFRKGDLVVGIEGTRVRGICEIEENGNESYIHDDHYEYAQTVGGNIQWVDWNESFLGKPPRTPAQGVKGIKSLRNAKNNVIAVWENRNN